MSSSRCSWKTRSASSVRPVASRARISRSTNALRSGCIATSERASPTLRASHPPADRASIRAASPASRSSSSRVTIGNAQNSSCRSPRTGPRHRRERLVQHLHGRIGGEHMSRLDQLAEPNRIHARRGDVQAIAGIRRLDPAITQRRPQTRHIRNRRSTSVVRRITVRPQGLQQPLVRERPSRITQQNRQDPALLQTTQLDALTGINNLQRAQQPELHAAKATPSRAATRLQRPRAALERDTDSWPPELTPLRHPVATVSRIRRTVASTNP